VHESPSIIGARAEREVAYALERAGWQVYLPFFASHARVDLIAMRSEELVRVQCKTSRLRNGALVFRTCSNTGNVPRRYDGEIDVFGVYSPELDKVYLVPSANVPASEWCYLRVQAAANNQRVGIRYAADYEVTPRR
jgi:hypothetical protein